MPLPSRPSRPTRPSRPVRGEEEEIQESPRRQLPTKRLPVRRQEFSDGDYEETLAPAQAEDNDFSFGFGDDGEDDDNFSSAFLTDSSQDQYAVEEDEDEESSDYAYQNDDYSYQEEAPVVLGEFEATDSESFGVSDPNEEFYAGGEFAEEFAMDYEEYEMEDTDETDHIFLVNNAIDALPEESREAAENFFELLDDDEISEVLPRGPKKFLYKKKGRILRAQNITFPNTQAYHHFLNTVVLALTETTEEIDGTNHLIEGRLTFPSPDENVAPLTARVHMVTPPVVKDAIVTIAKKSRIQYTLDDMVEFGTLTPNMRKFLEAVARGKATTVFSGVSGSGKTTLIEAMAYYFDPDDNVVVVEDTPELRIQAGNVIALTANTPKPGMSDKEIISMEWLVKATNRMRPDRIVVGECRGEEFSEFLIAANSGADGSMTTIHAENPRGTLNKMLSLAIKNSTSKSEEAVVRDISSTVQIIVQASLIDDKHIISSIEEVSNSITNQGRTIGTQTIFEYDRMKKRHIAKNQPSDELKDFLRQRGIEVENDWFRF